VLQNEKAQTPLVVETVKAFSAQGIAVDEADVREALSLLLSGQAMNDVARVIQIPSSPGSNCRRASSRISVTFLKTFRTFSLARPLWMSFRMCGMLGGSAVHSCATQVAPNQAELRRRE
jgi:hypothetical protein